MQQARAFHMSELYVGAVTLSKMTGKNQLSERFCSGPELYSPRLYGRAKLPLSDESAHFNSPDQG